MMKSLQKMKRVMLACLMLTPATFSFGQGGCIEIKSILVDACGTPEGENEMVRFDVGPAALNTTNMTVDWPNNNWLGLCQDATTAAIVSTLNANIQGCGSLVEPTGGALPANAKVLICTSTNINTTANTFTNLNDDLIILFQCAGNTSGHFANYSSTPGTRTLSIAFSGAGGCTDSVTYERSSLVNQFGQIGGFSFDNDGSFVDFTASGTATYLNNGCQALSSGLNVTGGPDVGICPGGSSVAVLNGSGSNIVGNVSWSGGTGTFNPPNALSTTYTPGPGETGLVYATITANGPCGAVETDTVRINIVPSLPTVNITSNVAGVFFSSVTDPQYFYNWYPDGSSTYIPGAFSPTFTPNANGCYYMILSTIGGCNVQSNTLCITNVGLNDPQAGASMNLFESPGNAPWVKMNTSLQPGTVNVNILDVSGRLVRKTSFESGSNLFEIHPDWDGIAAGTYMIRISGDNWSVQGKAILTK